MAMVEMAKTVAEVPPHKSAIELKKDAEAATLLASKKDDKTEGIDAAAIDVEKALQATKLKAKAFPNKKKEGCGLFGRGAPNAKRLFQE